MLDSNSMPHNTTQQTKPRRPTRTNASDLGGAIQPKLPLLLWAALGLPRYCRAGNGPGTKTHPRPHPRPPKTTQDHTTPHNTPPNPTQDLPRPAQDHPRPRF